ncbi:MAG TPA: hypothetical protein VK936_14390 [Longimicrobiales bacterium]|nr:hypothetical protein [Longimicrobiales bacterium]
MVDLGSGGNLCINCHQARPMTPRPTIGGAPVAITSFRYGPHYGPQANIAAAQGFFHFVGSRTYPATPMAHGLAGCPDCHMVTPVGDQAGGHTFRLTYGADGSTELIRACTQCHSSAASFDFMGAQTSTAELMIVLKDLLTAEGIMRADNYANTGTFDADVAAAFLNYKAVYHDGSLGVHHPEYVAALLINTIEAMQARVQ